MNLISEKEIEDWYADRHNNNGEFKWSDSPYVTYGDIVEEIKDFYKEFAQEKMKGLMVELTDRIKSMKDDSGRVGCTYGDTDYDSPSAVYGYNLAIENVVKFLEERK